MTSLATRITTIVLPRIAGTLSILGSLAIIVSMLIDGGKRFKSSFNRLLFMLCVFDIFASTSQVWSSSALPKDFYDYYYGAAGNWTTCRMQGVFLQLGMAVPVYFYFLTVHYLLVIRYGMKEERIRRGIEPLMHSFALTFTIGTCIAGLAMNLFNPHGNGCWLAEYPPRCLHPDSDVDCIYGENVTFYIWIFAGIPSILPLFLVPFTMGLIFWTVRKQSQKMNRYNPNSLFVASTSRTRRSSTAWPSSTSRQLASKDNLSSDDFSSISALRRKLKCKTTKRVKAVAHQGLAYTLCYLIVFSWPIILNLFIRYSKDNMAPFSISILYNIFYPLQGFLNYIVYVRPFVARMRSKHPEWSILRAMYVVTFPKRPGRLIHSISICEKLNCSLKRDENKNTESSGVEDHPKSGGDLNQDGGKDCDLVEKKPEPEEQEEKDNHQSETENCSIEDAEQALVEALTRAASHWDESEEILNAEEEIKQESEYFEAITELSKITGNYS